MGAMQAMNQDFVFTPFLERDLKEAGDLWNRCFSKAYKVDAFLLGQKLWTDPSFYGPASLACKKDGRLAGAIVCKLSDNRMPEYQNTAWLSTLFVAPEERQKSIGSTLFQKAEVALREAGVIKVLAGGELNNFFSGIPEPSEASRGLFTKMGFTLNTEEHYDLMANASQIDFESLPLKYNKSQAYLTRPYQPEDRKALESFFDSEFPGRWKLEIMDFIEGGGNPEHLLVLVNESQVKGFCKIHVCEKASGMGLYLGSSWGSLGPVGIALELRGSGFGNRLLRDSLVYLKQQGAGNVNIDWTILKGFYGQFGFQPWRTYLGAYKRL